MLTGRSLGNENKASDELQTQDINLSYGKVDVLNLFFYKFLCKAIIYNYILNITLRKFKYAAILYYWVASLNR